MCLWSDKLKQMITFKVCVLKAKLFSFYLLQTYHTACFLFGTFLGQLLDFDLNFDMFGVDILTLATFEVKIVCLTRNMLPWQQFCQNTSNEKDLCEEDIWDLEESRLLALFIDYSNRVILNLRYFP